jgi:PAS domain S-box-containing protein
MLQAGPHGFGLFFVLALIATCCEKKRMLVLHSRELKYAMPASIGAKSSPCIGIRMCDAGRFVVCIDCRLSVEFPAGAHYDTIARQFESHPCGSASLSKDNALYAKTVKPHDPILEILNRFDFDQNAAPMWVFDISTLAFVAVNDAAVRQYGYSRNEFLSMTILDIRPSEDIVPLLREIMHKGMHTSAKKRCRHKKKDGSLIDVDVTRCELLFNGCVSDIVTAVDVTGRLPVRSSDHEAQIPTELRSPSGSVLSKNDAPPSRLRNA